MNSDENCEEDEEDDVVPEGYDGPYKMVFVVNMSLGMGVGKIAAQVILIHNFKDSKHYCYRASFLFVKGGTCCIRVTP